ncbi:hypothetical protein CEUSTIGMA_g4589.t1 [Chlamydomonas eustigma]|uniref:Uncharacterized protein n=1 Tax=Chlamydomonas eustigma TaxID=1157962 RepID=A0A250X225_9CHLO|nr:hypothetical protein CEUSTIGMA_g4589.t1 [Chlamydomonas eustigma]|eukprot:GAX77143.1 hypothetical protein CEUSTIGMA_g4589.t1 [Chlamydomonas eustigma]
MYLRVDSLRFLSTQRNASCICEVSSMSHYLFQERTSFANTVTLFAFLALLGSKASLKHEKKERRQLFLKKRKEAALLEAETQQSSVWYKVREDGVWEEHRRNNHEREEFYEKRRSKNPLPAASAGKIRADTGSVFTLQELLSVKMRVRPPPPAEWLRAAGPSDFLSDEDDSVVEEEHSLQRSYDHGDQQGESRRMQQAEESCTNDVEQDPMVEAMPPENISGRIKMPQQPWKSRRKLDEWRKRKNSAAEVRLESN